MHYLRQKHWFDSEEFKTNYHCDLPFGSFCSPSGTLFRLWAPTAEKVHLYLFEEGTGDGLLDAVELTPVDRGVWIYETRHNLDGIYYEYDVTVDGTTRRTADPYAKACGLNGRRSMVIDLRRTDPEGWADDVSPAHTPEQIIYELHVKDFSWDPSGGFSSADRGRYSALCCNGTTLNHDKVHPTGLDYMKRLGITHVQLLPVYDYGSVDESCPDEQYNWGYDPVNYNIPEGSYSSDPSHGEVRIKELKQAIQSLHRNGFRVIMDVVYNHTYALDSWLWRTVPWYYNRQNDDGTASNGSGCGNELASERSMCAKYILDSVLYWAEEYHMDGFRFDLMGLLDVDLMNQIQKSLDTRFGKGEKLVYGEPWGAASSAARPGTILSTKEHLRSLSPSIGAFCDNTRDAVKGSLMNEMAVGFVNGGGISADYLAHCISGWSLSEHAQVQAPSQTITYLSCHDDWTLWDKLVFTLLPNKDFRSISTEIVRRNRLAASINFCCQGRLFFQAGEEFGRTKNGIKNSYKSDSSINQLDWSRAWENSLLVDHYRGLAYLRQLLPCLYDKTEQASKRILSAFEPVPDCVCISMDNADPCSRWDTILMIFHTGPNPQKISLPGGTWQVLADDVTSFRWQENMTIESTTTIPGMSALILGYKEK